MAEWMQMIGASFVLVMGMMIVLWLVYMVQKNAGIVDLGWALGFALTGLVFMLLGEGYGVRRFLMGIMILIWSLRLLSHLFRRYQGSVEDPRYQKIKEEWGENHLDFKMLAMFLLQGVVVLILSFSFLIPMNNPLYSLGRWEFIGIVVWLLGVLGEAYSDKQLRRFQRQPENKGKVCDKGWWRYSRHPNYFFEFVVWVGFFLFSLGSPWGITSLYAPVLMLLLLLKISGVPPAEAQSLASKGEAYEDYQRRTSVFLPWFPKK